MVEVLFGPTEANVSEGTKEVQLAEFRFHVIVKKDATDVDAYCLNDDRYGIIDRLSIVGQDIDSYIVVALADSEEEAISWIDELPKENIISCTPTHLDKLEESHSGAEEEPQIEADAEPEKWYDMLDPDEMVQSDGQAFPKLSGLRRLAKDIIMHEDVQINFVGMIQREIRRELREYEWDDNGEKKVIRSREEIGSDYLPYASVTYTVTLVDGRTFADSADAYLGNCDQLGNYPTAVATARAEGRALRKVLGIKEHTFEELSEKNAVDEITSAEDTPIAAEQKKLLDKMLSSSEMSLADLLGEIDTGLTNLDQMTSAQAKNALRLLNDLKKKKKKK